MSTIFTRNASKVREACIYLRNNLWHCNDLFLNVHKYNTTTVRICVTFIKIFLHKYILDCMEHCAKPFRIDTCLQYILLTPRLSERMHSASTFKIFRHKKPCIDSHSLHVIYHTHSTSPFAARRVL